METPNTSFNFDPIAARYDVCNHLFSGGLDHYWRRRTVRTLDPRPDHRVLDLCCGTGDLVFAFAKHSPARSITGLDLSEPMLRRARRKQQGRWDDRLAWVTADAAQTGLPDASFDIITCAFGLRNIPDRLAALKEIRRLLAPDGRAVILEFSLPENPLVRPLYLFYLRVLMPLGGRLLFTGSGPLRYLAQSIRQWSTDFDLPQTAARAGLEHTARLPLTAGIVTLDLLRPS